MNRSNRRPGFILFIICAALLSPDAVSAVTLRIAVASNFLAAGKEVARIFQEKSGHEIAFSSASTGKLYAQIINGAPYDIFLAANHREPKRLEQQGLIMHKSRFTYAKGRLIVMSSYPDSISTNLLPRLKQGEWQRLAIANPRTAPYGVAAKQVLQHLKLWDKSRQKLIRGENIGQAFYFTRSGNAELGLLALSQVKLMSDKPSVKYSIIPEDWYQPLEQQAVILKRTSQPSAAEAFMALLQDVEVKKLLAHKYGYAEIK